MKKFVLKLLLFFILLLISDYLIGIMFNRIFYVYSDKGNQQTIYAMEQANAELYIFGSSRARHTFIPSILSDSLNINCSNLGRDGQGIYYHYAVLNALLKRSNPQIVIIELVKEEYLKTTTNEDIDRLSVLLPFHKNHPEITEIVNKRSKFEKLKLFSKIYPYNSMLFNMTGFLNNKENNKKYDGYEPLYGIYDGQIREININEQRDCDEDKLFILENFLKKLNDINCEIYAVSSPIYAKIRKENEYSKIYRMFDKYNVTFLNFSQDSLFISHPEWFQDAVHLNHTGATAFSKEIAHKIKKRIQS